jgi:hypothetical protein
VEKTATSREIRVAFKKKAVTTHPDKNPEDSDASAKMAELNEVVTLLLYTAVALLLYFYYTGVRLILHC